jgi:hypothetical protein
MVLVRHRLSPACVQHAVVGGFAALGGKRRRQAARKHPKFEPSTFSCANFQLILAEVATRSWNCKVGCVKTKDQTVAQLWISRHLYSRFSARGKERKRYMDRQFRLQGARKKNVTRLTWGLWLLSILSALLLVANLLRRPSVFWHK